MRRVVIRLSKVALAALTVAMIGAAISLYGKMQGHHTANVVGSVMLFGGAIVYVIERLRAARQKLD